MRTPIGPLTILAADGAILAGGFTEDVGSLASRLAPGLRDAPLQVVSDVGPITERLTAYFDGDVLALDGLAVAMHGGPFQQRVWTALREIRPGERTTYRDLAARLGSQNLARAVGMGCATNLISPIVPCHRVTRTGGNLAGYYWGLERKRWLLDHERRHARSDSPLLPRQREGLGGEGLPPATMWVRRPKAAITLCFWGR
jgi:methylated-DNA-[protein]-cysteine S-methyltransferase